MRLGFGVLQLSSQGVLGPDAARAGGGVRGAERRARPAAPDRERAEQMMERFPDGR